MAEFSKISWTDATFNFAWGCTEVGPGCDNCYAREFAKRFDYGWGQGAPRRFFGDKHWNEPLKWNEKAKREGKKKKVFCASMADWADNEVGQEHRDRLFALIKKTDRLIWQLLTKRVGNARKMLPQDWGNGYENVWFGITVVNQEEADRDFSKLLDIPARLRWLSVEPQLGPIEFERPWMAYQFDRLNKGEYPKRVREMLHWVVIGGESGPLGKVRPFDFRWARSGITQCREAGVPVFIKQMGARTFADPEDGAPLLRTFSHADAANPEKWPSDLRIQEFPEWK